MEITCWSWIKANRPGGEATNVLAINSSVLQWHAWPFPPPPHQIAQKQECWGALVSLNHHLKNWYLSIGSIVFLLCTVFKLYLQSNYDDAVNLTSSDGSWVTSCGSCLRSRYFLIHSTRELASASWGNKNCLSGEVGGDHQLIMWRQKKVGGDLGQWNSVWFPGNGLQNLSCKYELSIAEWEGLIFSHPDELWRNINQCLGITKVKS